MSATSDIYISREEAIKMVKSRLMGDQEFLIDKAIESMNDCDLTGFLNDGDYYYYNIENGEDPFWMLDDLDENVDKD